MRPDADLTVSEWADAHRMLGSRASAEPGRYRTARTPYMREIMDALSPSSAVQRIVFMKAAQVGATEAGNNWIGFAIHQAPGPMLAVQEMFGLDPFCGAVFVFRSKRADRIKLLVWDQTGMVLVHKRLEDGKFVCPL
jgi:phage terminase large subunit GpA-like protein